jgi:hypothetical protein
MENGAMPDLLYTQVCLLCMREDEMKDARHGGSMKENNQTQVILACSALKRPASL